MPLWTVYHSSGTYTAADKQAFAEAVVSLYPILPEFYVGTVFRELPADDFYIGGKPAGSFVRIAVDHIARQFSSDDMRQRWLNMVNAALEPFLGGRGFDWEMHVDETPSELWLIQGMRPPQPNSEGEKLWQAENRPVALPASSSPPR